MHYENKEFNYTDLKNERRRRRDFFELNTLGKAVVSVCPRFDNHVGPRCCTRYYYPFDNNLIHSPYVKYSYSIKVRIFNLHDKWFDRIQYSEPELFNKKNFAKSTSVQENIEIVTRPSPKTDSRKDIPHELDKEECKGCGLSLPINAIMKHVSHSEKCKNSYNDSDLQALKYKILQFKNKNRRAKRQENSNEKKIPINERFGRPNFDDDFYIDCKGCKSKLPANTINKHLANKPDCKAQYTEKEFSELSIKISGIYKRNKNNYEKYKYDQNKKAENLHFDCKHCGRSFNAAGIQKHIFSPSKNCSSAYTETDIIQLHESLKPHTSNVKSSINARYFSKQTDLKVQEKFESTIQKDWNFDFCFSCKKPFDLSRIQKHLGHSPDCKTKYSDEALLALQTKCEQYQKDMKRIKRKNKPKSNTEDEA